MNVAPGAPCRFLLTPDDLPEIIDWRDFFGNEGPVEIEVGSGRGLFLITAGSKRPETNFLGIEVARKYAKLSATHVVKRSMPNVRVLNADACLFFSRHVPSDSVRAVHVYFPDPWWKRRHKKRRVLSETFAHDVERVLIPGGFLHIWTDVEEYFEATQSLLAKHTGLDQLDPPEQREPQHDMDYQTNFERKMRRRGRPIFRARARKRAPDGENGEKES